MLSALLLWVVTLELPAVALDPRNVAAIRIVARDGSLLRSVLSPKDGGAIWVPLSMISPHVIQATLAAEDRRFYQHAGVDLRAVLRALWSNITHGRVVSGASTITMQLIRLLQPAPRSIGNKLREAILAYKLERTLRKEQILWLYLNRAPYGNRTFGVEAAAWRYFNKPAQRLSLAEAALLAALPRRPSGYDPYHHRPRLVQRQRLILQRMVAQQRISAEQQRLALVEPLRWEAARRPFYAPHATQRVLALPAARQATWIKTTIDLALQEKVEAAVEQLTERLSAKRVTNAAVLVVDNASAEVLAYVGSADFFDEKHSGQVDGTQARRQGGSAMKPFTYGLALERGATAATVLQDLPAHFATPHGDYAPRNYDDTFHGPVRLRVALGSSYNVPAVRLAEQVGVERLLERLHALGFRSLQKPARHYGLGLTLGNGEVTLEELVGAYAALARGGIYQPLQLIKEARDAEGGAAVLPRPAPRRVFQPQVAFLLSHILSDEAARLPAFGKDSVLQVGFPAAVKTGTSKDFRDNWTIGYTPQVTVGVWVGNFDGSTMQRVSGISGAGPLWAEVLRAAHGQRATAFPPPKGLVTRTICPLSGQLLGPHCRGSVEEIFVAGSEPQVPCAMHQEVALDTRNGLRAGPHCSAEHVQREVHTIYPPVFRAWAAAALGDQGPPLLDSPLCPRPVNAPATVTIRFPSSGDRYYLDADLRRQHQRLPLEAIVEGTATQVHWYVDGKKVAQAAFPWRAFWPLHVGRHTIEAILSPEQRSAPVTITVQ